MQVQLRSTTLKTYNGRIVYIPNQEVFQASITNSTAAKYLRSSVTVGIDYDADIFEARQVIIKTLQALNQVQPEPTAKVLVYELAASTVNLEFRFWATLTERAFWISHCWWPKLSKTHRKRKTLKYQQKFTRWWSKISSNR